MPTYEYECQKCGHKFDLFQSITSDPTADCPRCGGHSKRLIGNGAGVIFKGSGFYATDYRNKKEDKTDGKRRDEKSNNCPMNMDCKECQAPKE